MSMSHARLHCVTHTNTRPFKCHRCSFATNTKGNTLFPLYEEIFFTNTKCCSAHLLSQELFNQLKLYRILFHCVEILVCKSIKTKNMIIYLYIKKCLRHISAVSRHRTFFSASWLQRLERYLQTDPTLKG